MGQLVCAWVCALWLCSSLLQLSTAVPTPEESNTIVKRLDDPESIARRKNKWHCSIYRKRIPNPSDPNGPPEWVSTNRDASLHDCFDVCGDAVSKQTNAGNYSSISCFSDISDDSVWQVDTTFNDGTEIGPGNCTCNSPLIDTIVEDFVDALPEVAEIGCDIIMSAISLVVEVGAAAIPGVGEAIDGGMIAGIQAAKLADYTYDGATNGLDAFSNWASNSICGTSDLPPDLQKAFGVLNSANPGVLPKGSYFRDGNEPKWEKGSGRSGDKGDPKGDPKGDHKGHPKNLATYTIPPPHNVIPKFTDGPNAKPLSDFLTEEPKPTNIPKQCTKNNERRGSGGKKPTDDDCEVDDKTTHIYVADNTVQEDKLTTVTKSCSAGDYPQACAFYYYAIKDRGGRSKFTCENSIGRQKGSATASWKSEHQSDWRVYTNSDYSFKGESKDKGPRCEADEWPPAYFLPSNPQEKQKPEWGQLIRWLPGSENGGAANSMWGSFCNKYDGGEGNGQRESIQADRRPPEQIPFNEKLVKLGKYDTSKVEHNGQTTITTRYSTITFTRAVFEIEFDYSDDKVPAAKNEWFLEDNPCWPKDIVPDDPGFVLLTDDNWYTTHKFPDGYDASKIKAQYSLSPDADFVKSAKARQAQAGDKRPKPGDSGAPPAKKPPANPPSKRLILLADDLAVTDDERNTTRRLTKEEMDEDLEVIQCSDRSCSKERDALDEDPALLFIPGTGPPSTPSVNIAIPTLLTSFVATPALARPLPASESRPLVTAAPIQL